MISVCPECESKVSIPAGSEIGQAFECPHCQAQFELTKILEQDAENLKPISKESFGAGILDETSEEASEDEGTLRIAPATSHKDGDSSALDAGEIAEDVLEEVTETVSIDGGASDLLSAGVGALDEGVGDGSGIELESTGKIAAGDGGLISESLGAASDLASDTLDDVTDAGEAAIDGASDLLSAGAGAVAGLGAAAAGAMAFGGGSDDSESDENSTDSDETASTELDQIVDETAIEFDFDEAVEITAPDFEEDCNLDEIDELAALGDAPKQVSDEIAESMEEIDLSSDEGIGADFEEVAFESVDDLESPSIDFDESTAIDFTTAAGDTVENLVDNVSDAVGGVGDEILEGAESTADFVAEGGSAVLGVGTAAVGGVGAAIGMALNAGDSDAGQVEVVKPFDLPPASMDGFTPGVPRRKRNMLWTITKIALGGVVGLFLAQLFLWWAMKKDPLGIATKMGPVAFLTPAELRLGSPPAVTTIPGIVPAAATEPLVEEDFPDQESDQDAFPTEVTTARPDSTAIADTSPVLPSAVEDEFPADILGDETTSDAGNELPTLPSPAASPTELTMMNQPQFTWSDVNDALSIANVAKTEFDLAMEGPTTRSEKEAKVRAFYDNCCDVAARVTFAGPPNEVLGSVESMLQNAAGNSTVATVMGRLPRVRLRNSPTGTGICLTGIVRGSGPIFGGMELSIELLDKPGKPGPLVTCVQAVNPSEPASLPESGDRVIVLGVLSNTPTTEIASYESHGGPVLWVGHITPIQ